MHGTTLDTPIGPLTVTVDDEGAVTAVLFAAERSVTPTRASDRAADELREYFAGERTSFTLPLAPSGTDFQRKVWLALREIPYGVTESYGEVAQRIGQPTASRAVGLANGRNPIAIIVPCHRVIGASGTLTGYAGGLERKRWLLDHESGTQQSLV